MVIVAKVVEKGQIKMVLSDETKRHITRVFIQPKKSEEKINEKIFTNEIT